MTSMTDVVGCSNLHPCEIEAIAEHEHVPMPVAVMIGENLLHTQEGVCLLHQMVAEDINLALEANDLAKAMKFAQTYRFVESHRPLLRHDA